MPITAQEVAAIAELYLVAEQHAVPVTPISERYPNLSEDDAYAAQRELVLRKLAGGGVMTGYKIAATNPGAQAHFGLGQPAYGVLIERGHVVSGGMIEARELIQPRLECEVAFRLASDLRGPGVTPEAALAATAGMMAAFEIADARTVGWAAKMPEAIVDNGFAARYVISDQIVSVAGHDLAALGVTLYKNGQVLAQGSGANVLGSPANALAWLANRLAEHSRQLRAGEIVLAGSLTPLQPVDAGSTFEAVFDQLGSVRVRFV